MAKSARIAPFLKRLLYAVLATSWCSGITFFILNQWVTVAGEFGPEKHPWQFGVLRIHGAGAFAMMILFGYLLASHVKVSWSLRHRHPFGLALVVMIAFLIVSAYGLYYIGDSDFRTYLAYSHAATGVSLPFVLTAHLAQDRQRKRRTQKRTARSTGPA